MGCVTTDKTPRGQMAALQLTLFPWCIVSSYYYEICHHLQELQHVTELQHVPNVASPRFPPTALSSAYWATVVSRTCHALFHLTGDYNCLLLFPVYLSLPCPPWKSSISPMQTYLWSLPWTLNANRCPLYIPRETGTRWTLTLWTLYCSHQPLS